MLLTQILGRPLGEEARRVVREADFQHRLEEIHAQVEDLLSTKRVVKGKAERDYERVKALAVDLAREPGSKQRENALKEERENL